MEKKNIQVFYGILKMSSTKLIDVSLKKKDICYKFDMELLDPDKYSIVRLEISIGDIAED